MKWENPSREMIQDWVVVIRVAFRVNQDDQEGYTASLQEYVSCWDSGPIVGLRSSC